MVSDEEGEFHIFRGVFPITGLTLTDPYLIGAVLAERSNVSVEDMKEVKVPEQFYGKVPAGDLIYIMTHGMLNNLEVAQDIWRRKLQRSI